MNKIKIMLVDDQNLYLESVKIALETQKDLEVIALVKNGKEAVDKIEEIKPDIILMDISMPEMDGIDAAELILERYKNQKIILVSSFSNRNYVSKAFQIGVSAYFLKDEGMIQIVNVIHIVINGDSYFSPRISKIIAELYKNNEYTSNMIENKLTPKESEVFKLWSQGKMDKELAASLNCTTSNIEKIKLNIKNKLNIQTASEATLLAIREGIIRIEDFHNC